VCGFYTRVGVAAGSAGHHMLIRACMAETLAAGRSHRQEGRAGPAPGPEHPAERDCCETPGFVERPPHTGLTGYRGISSESPANTSGEMP
jgi:hypothetical protein